MHVPFVREAPAGPAGHYSWIPRREKVTVVDYYWPGMETAMVGGGCWPAIHTAVKFGWLLDNRGNSHGVSSKRKITVVDYYWPSMETSIVADGCLPAIDTAMLLDACWFASEAVMVV